MQNVYLEWFLFDNALMAYLILRSAAALARLPVRSWLLYLISILSAAASAAAMIDPFFLSIPAKCLLLFSMTLPLRWKTKKQWGRSVITVLTSTFFFGGMAYALAFFFESDFRGGVLYASSSIRAVLVSAVIALWVPKYIRRTLQTNRLSRTRVFLKVETRFGSQAMHARLDSGHSLCVDDAPVIVVDAKTAGPVLPPEWADGRWFDFGVPGMGILPFRNTSDHGIMPTLPATISWRWEEEEIPGEAPEPKEEGTHSSALKWKDKRSKGRQKKAEVWLETRACRIAVASERLDGCDALLGLDFIELH